MSIEWFRDLFICIFGISATIFLVFMAVLAFSLYRRLKPIISSVKETTRTVQHLTSTVEEQVAGPLAQVAAFVQGVRQAVNLVSGFVKRNKEE